jgi:hypothetical protein|tara:strand:- start:1440 stop:1580 length:141 start_codon:yes stop_codon:yes gene_type:complete
MLLWTGENFELEKPVRGDVNNPFVMSINPFVVSLSNHRPHNQGNGP